MPKTDPEEVNLLDLLVSFYRALRRNLLLVILIPLAGVVTALVYEGTREPSYESGLLLETCLLTEEECKFLAAQFEKSDVIPGLAPEARSKVGRLEFAVRKKEYELVADEKGLKDYPLYIEVTASVSDSLVLPSLETAIVSFVDQHPATTRRRKDRLEFYNGLIHKIDNEIIAMEKVKEQVSANVQATYLNPAELYSKTVELQKEKMLYKMRVEDAKVIHVVERLNSLVAKREPNNIKAAALGMLIGIAVLLLVLFAQFFREYSSSQPQRQ